MRSREVKGHAPCVAGLQLTYTITEGRALKYDFDYILVHACTRRIDNHDIWFSMRTDKTVG